MPTLAAALAIVVLGVPALLYVTWPLLRRRSGGTVAVDEERAALEAEKVTALLALRELLADREAGHLSEEAFVEERDRHEALVAAVLHRLDALPPPAPPAAAPRGTVPAAGPWTRQPAVLASLAFGILGFGVALGVLLTRNTAPAPVEGQMSAGSAGVPTGPPPFMAGPEVAPGTGGGSRPLPAGMLQGMLQAARASLEAGRYQEAIAAYKAILKREPRNVDAITHLGLILAIAGHADGALDAFDRALGIDANYAEALWYKGNVLADGKRDERGAIAAWERFTQVAAPGPERDQALTRIREARARLAGGTPTPPPARTDAGNRGTVSPSLPAKP